MDERLMRRLEQISPEEQELLNGRRDVDPTIYFSGEKNVVDSAKLLGHGKLITIRTHTRFIEFPPHRHNYIEMMYVCKGTITHQINGEDVQLRQGDLLLLNQYTPHAVHAAGEGDIGINFIVLPQFFDLPLAMVGKKNILADFLIGVLRQNSVRGRYLHFHIAGILPIENLLENLVYSLVNPEAGDVQLNQTTMGLLFLYLVRYTGCLTEDSPTSQDEALVMTAIRYIDQTYQSATLAELAHTLNQSTPALSRAIKAKTGHTFKELLQRKRFQIAMTMLCDTDLPVNDIILAVGYENNSYFHRRFREKFHMSPKEYRLQHRQGVIQT